MLIEARDLVHIYAKGTAFSQRALDEVSLQVAKGEFIGIIGHTGSGKSTLIQHLNGLLRADSGSYCFRGDSVYEKGFDMKVLRQKVGLVFQYPEHQLFEVDVLSDVSFGPKNQGLSEEEVLSRAKEALSLVGLGEEFYKKSPFELSGGQKRRVAIAGVIAMHPEVLILDEPTAGLDPKGRDEILSRIRLLREEMGVTILLVSHSMEDIADYVDRIIVMHEGKKLLDGSVKEVFMEYKRLEAIGLKAPQIFYLVQRLRKEGLAIPEDITTVREAREAIIKLFAAKKGRRG